MRKLKIIKHTREGDKSNEKLLTVPLFSEVRGNGGNFPFCEAEKLIVLIYVIQYHT